MGRLESRQELFRECSAYAELVTVPEQLPRVLEIAMRAALERRGVTVVVIPARSSSIPSGAPGKSDPAERLDHPPR